MALAERILVTLIIFAALNEFRFELLHAQSITSSMPKSPDNKQIQIRKSKTENAISSKKRLKLPNVVPALDSEDDQQYYTYASKYCPIKDKPFTEHVREKISTYEKEYVQKLFDQKLDLKNIMFSPEVSAEDITAMVKNNGKIWIASNKGLYLLDSSNRLAKRHENYGIRGPLATTITALAVDSKGTLWIGTPLGLSLLNPDGTWRSIQGKDGLPVEDVTALTFAINDQLWIGTSEGAILYLPYEKVGRQWFYRAGKRYLVNNQITDIVVSQKGTPVYFKTASGISKIDIDTLTLKKRADIIEKRINERHRRLGLVAACSSDDAENPTSFFIRDNDNDGLWTSYHVVAMSLAYAATGENAYLTSAKESMHAMIMLQNASGIPGLVARSVLPASERKNKGEQWRLTPDGRMLWKSDTSSDEIDGHFFALYAYWEHIAQHDPQEKVLIQVQTNKIMSYIVDNNYQLIDWDGERTRWGFWNPEILNGDPYHYVENGLNAAQILSFLKVAYHITGNTRFKKHYEYLINEHGYLGNILLEKKVFPDENNHSDNQLGFCALYPFLQLEKDPQISNALQKAVRRHYKTLWKDGSSFFYFAAATIDQDFVDIKAAVENLRQTPTDRRQWKMVNSNRADITWNPRLSRFGRRQLLHVLPVDERNWAKWNGNPYYPDGGIGGNVEDDGASWLLGYWMGRYHGFIDG
jgi:hypothetical protein